MKPATVGQTLWFKARTFQLRAAGFSAPFAREWVRRVDQDRRSRSEFSKGTKRRAYRQGYLPSTIHSLELEENEIQQYVSERDYAFVHPLNGKYGKWVRDRVSVLKVFEPFRYLFEKTHFHLSVRDGAIDVIALSHFAKSYNASLMGVASVLLSGRALVLTESRWGRRTELHLGRAGSSLTIDGSTVSVDEFTDMLQQQLGDGSYVLLENARRLRSAVDWDLQILMANPGGVDPHVAEAQLTREVSTSPTGSDRGRTVGYSVQSVVLLDADSGEAVASIVAGEDGEVRADRAPEHDVVVARVANEWSRIVADLTDLSRFVPQLEFVQFTMAFTDMGVKIVHITATPPYPRLFRFSSETVEFLRGRIAQKRSRAHRPAVRARKWLHNLKLKARKAFASVVFPAGLVPYQSIRWIGDVRRDCLERNGVPLRTKLWAYRRGFLSYRLPQYGITAENWTSFISDFEYRWLRHINRGHKHWLEDKISIKYVAAEFNDSLPAYYFFTSLLDGENHVVPMMDCPKGYAASYSEILRLARSIGVLALKPDDGSHGQGFFKLEYSNEEYRLNGVAVGAADVVSVLSNPTRQYLVTEYIAMHPDLAAIYPDSVNTIRMIVFKRDGKTPTVGNTYMRIGSRRSGFVDNTAAGGMLAVIDPDTGKFGNAQRLERGRVVPCPRHPDTGVLIEGMIPHWEYAKQRVLDIAESLPQLEYLGFDVAITPEGIKLPEINRFPDYPRIDLLTPETTEYLLAKLAEKKKRFGYDRTPPRSVIKFPVRAA